jgi:hypothetical protein
VATASELISPLRIRLDMSSALVVPVQNQAMITVKSSFSCHYLSNWPHLAHDVTDVSNTSHVLPLQVERSKTVLSKHVHKDTIYTRGNLTADGINRSYKSVTFHIWESIGHSIRSVSQSPKAKARRCDHWMRASRHKARLWSLHHLPTKQTGTTHVRQGLPYR